MTTIRPLSVLGALCLVACAFLAVGPDELSLEQACTTHVPTSRACDRW